MGIENNISHTCRCKQNDNDYFKLLINLTENHQVPVEEKKNLIYLLFLNNEKLCHFCCR